MNLVSIIIRTHKRYMLLERAIKHVKNQTFKQYKVIVVNDGGDKNKVLSILENNLSQDMYTVINLEENLGLNRSINIGARAVETKYVVILDDDDTWNPTFLEETISYLENNHTCYGVITYANLVYEKLMNSHIKIMNTKPFKTMPKGVVSMYDMLKNNQFPIMVFVYRAEVYESIGYFDETLEVLEDWEFNLRFLQKYDIHVIDRVLANYHIRQDNSILNLSYRNTVTHKKELHEKYDTIIRNKYLRYDLNSKEFGIGILMNIVRWSDSRILRAVKRALKIS